MLPPNRRVVARHAERSAARSEVAAMGNSRLISARSGLLRRQMA
ncbi:hypothetical protein N177_3110 [Lutibaculum baratangense AMV1]|uniref:Uncharacterized protein n=1 Tax=Lutibaculum baratangense AMV1 TaxID=631454 RepID=V4QTG1_9HYPH|nr:hypothetical protein N177_3110 [Lutibaculum baratangense AMV1]